MMIRPLFFALFFLVATTGVHAQLGGMGRIGGPIDNSIVNPTSRAGLASAHTFRVDNVQHPAPIDWGKEVQEQRNKLEELEKLQENNYRDEIERLQKLVAELEKEKQQITDEKEKERVENEQRTARNQQQEKEKERQRTLDDKVMPKNYVVLIGVNQYKQSKKEKTEGYKRVAELSLDDLKYAVKDMEDLSSTLIAGKFVSKENIVLMIDNQKEPQLLPTKENIKKQIAGILARLEISEKNNKDNNKAKNKEKSTVLVAFSGHGLAFPADSKGGFRSYLCPRGTDVFCYAEKQDEESKGGILKEVKPEKKKENTKWKLDGLISLEDLFKGLENEVNVKKVAFFDACRAELGAQNKKETEKLYEKDKSGHLVEPSLETVLEALQSEQSRNRLRKTSKTSRNGYTTAVPSLEDVKKYYTVESSSKLVAVRPVEQEMENGGTSSAKSSVEGLGSFTDGDIAKIRNLFRLSSCSVKQKALETAELKNGIFTSCLLKGIQGKADSNNNKKVEIAELAEFVKKEVKSYAAEYGNEQTPESNENEFEYCVISIY